jgi:MOSC domain-containing protein YiiM
MARLLSVNVGLPRDIAWRGRIVHTGIWKNPLPGRCRVGRLNLDGDGQGDLAGHGGEAVAYAPQPLEQPADGNLLVCCSQPVGDVVIDL